MLVHLRAVTRTTVRAKARVKSTAAHAPTRAFSTASNRLAVLCSHLHSSTKGRHKRRKPRMLCDGHSCIPFAAYLTSANQYPAGSFLLFLEYLLRCFTRQTILESDPVDMRFPKGMKLWCLINRGLKVGQGNMNFVRPATRFEKQG